MSSNGRSAEQVTADENLTKAIEESLKAYEFEEGYILTDYMVICAQAKLNDEGDTNSAYAYLYRDSDLPYHKILGLLRIATTRAEYNLNCT